MKYLFLLGCSLSIASPALAQVAEDVESNFTENPGISGTPILRSNEITVTAIGAGGKLSETGLSISILTSDDLKSIQGSDPVRLLERLPGVSLSRSGGLGSQTALFVRGANSQQVLVMIDGVRVDDQAAPSGGFDLGTLLNGGVGRIELLRGSNSLAWGSDAIGGVLAITSEARPGARASLEYGANNSINGEAGLGFADDGGAYVFGLSGGYFSSDGISAKVGGTEADPFRQWHLGGRGSLRLSDTLHLSAVGRYADSRVDFDGFPPPLFNFADTPEYQTTRQASGRVGLDYSSDGFELGAGVALSDTMRAYFDPTFGTAPNFETAGRGIHADLKGRVDLWDKFRLDFGADGDWSRFSTTFDLRQSARTRGVHALFGYHDDQLNLTMGGRLDDHDRFGSRTTFGANASFNIADNWRLRASWGQGFKAPTLSQLYGFGGNVSLKPETSEAFDAGLEFSDRNGARHVAITLFFRDSSNLIDYVSPTGYFNVGRARAQGFELEGATKIGGSLTFRAAYTYLDAANRLTGKDLARRPRHALSVSADLVTPLRDLSLGADLRVAGDSYDDAGNSVPIHSHAVLTLRASLPLGENLELYGRVENVTDAQYQTVAGYGTYGRSAYAGVRVKW